MSNVGEGFSPAFDGFVGVNVSLLHDHLGLAALLGIIVVDFESRVHGKSTLAPGLHHRFCGAFVRNRV